MTILSEVVFFLGWKWPQKTTPFGATFSFSYKTTFLLSLFIVEPPLRCFRWEGIFKLVFHSVELLLLKKCSSALMSQLNFFFRVLGKGFTRSIWERFFFACARVNKIHEINNWAKCCGESSQVLFFLLLSCSTLQTKSGYSKACDA